MRDVRTGNRCPVSFPLPRTARCNTCLSLRYMYKLGVHTCRFSRCPFVSSYFRSRAGDPSLDISRQESVFLFRKEHIAILAALLHSLTAIVWLRRDLAG